MSEQNPTRPSLTRPLQCEEWETLLVDALDGNLTTEQGVPFQAHGEICAACHQMLAEAKQGREWLQFLHREPEAPTELISKILARTTGAAPGPALANQAVVQGAAISPAPVPVPFWKTRPMVGLRRMAEPRLLMTAAMAFFSITLTLNVTGIKLTALRLSDLTPAAISTNVDREFHLASARVVRYYDNLRFVYEMEARVREIRRNADLNGDSNNPGTKQQAPPPVSNPAPKGGGKSEAPPRRSDQQSLVRGEAIEASFRAPEQANSTEECGTADAVEQCISSVRAERGRA